LALDQKFSGKDFVKLHVFADDIPSMFSDLTARTDYTQRYEQVLGIWEASCHNLPESWMFIDTERTIPVEFPFVEIRKLLDKAH
jgi:hypothetical protein